MVEQILNPPLVLSVPASLPAGQVVAVGVKPDDYMAQYAADHHEWVKGTVIKMTPVSLTHARLAKYFMALLEAYFSLKPIGTVLSEPFVMRLDSVEARREPDLQVILNTNPGQLTDTAMIGPADICIEIVSPESATRDYGDKFVEYEKAGVGEYWIIDPLRQIARFHRLQATKFYAEIHPDDSGHYRTPALPGLTIHVPTLWQDELPNFIAIADAVRALLADS